MDRTQFIKQNIFGKILDIGCEYGNLHSLIYNKNLYGLDLNPKEYRKNVVKGDAQSIPFRNSTFNSLVCGELIEHLENPKKFLQECKRILKKNGLIILSTPNKNSLINKLFKSYHHHEHISLFDIKSLKTLVSKYFIVQKIIILPYDKVSSWGARHKILIPLRRLIHYFLPETLKENIIIKASKK